MVTGALKCKTEQRRNTIKTQTLTYPQLHATKYSPAGERHGKEGRRIWGGNRREERGAVQG